MPPTSPSNDLPWADLGRWLSGEMDSAEAAAFERWVHDDAERAAVVLAMREAWTAGGKAGEGWDAAAAMRRVRAAAAEEARVIARLGGERPMLAGAGVTRRNGWYPALRVAAVIAVVVGAGYAVERAAHRPVALAPATMVEYRTHPGQRLALHLGDGTQVTLAPGSVLRRPSDYGVRERRLELTGEAYFVVTYDSTRLFTVRTRTLLTQDLGTRFDVRAYDDEPASAVVVAEGRVALRPERARKPTVLTPGQLARMGEGGDVMVKSGVSVDRYLAWTQGRLVFRDTPLREVASQLERWYDVEVRLPSELAELRVTGVFADEPVTQVLDAVARSLDLRIQRVGGSYELSRSPS